MGISWVGKIEFISSVGASLNLHEKVLSSAKSMNLKKVEHFGKSLMKI